MKNFFRESAAFAEKNAQLFDFIHTSSVALWNLRWQVQGFVGARPAATEKELSDRFASGSDIRGINLKRACIENSWEEQLSQFAQIIIGNLIGMYEGWAGELMPKFGPGLIKKVQFPSRGRYGQSSDGVGEALAQVRSVGISNEIKKAFFPKLASNRKYSLSSLDALLAMYRYHKEVRNSLMHRGGVADAKAENAWRNASGLTQADIGGRSVPALSVIIDGTPVRTNIYEAIQLSDIIMRIVLTLDAELCFTEVGEQRFLDDWRNSREARKLREFPSDLSRRAPRVATICHRMGYTTPADTDAIYRLGRRERLIF